MLLPLLASAGLAAEVITVPYRLRPSGHLEVMLSIEGGDEIPFVVDTGATVTMIAASTWAATSRADNRGIPLAGQGAGGKVSVRLVTGVDIVLGGEDVRVGAAVVGDLPEDEQGAIHGLLGRDVLRRYLVEVDPKAQVIRLHPPRAFAADPEAFVVLPMEPTRGRLSSVDISLGGAPVTAVIDLGAQGSVINRVAGTAAKVHKAEGAVPFSGQGVGGGSLDFALVETSSLRLGDLELGPMHLAEADLPVFGPLRLDDEPAMILGLDVLGGRHLYLDDHARTLAISRVR
jgi:hypothetical protein